MERPRKTGTSNLRWRRDMHEFLMAFLVDQAKKGLKIDKTFKKQAFKDAVKAVNERFDVEVSKANIENHIKTIKAKHVTVKRLLSTNGVTFDPDKKQINMSPEALRKHLKVRPNDDTYLNRPIEFFDEMNIICGDNYVNGNFAKGITDTIKIDVDMASPENLGPFVDAVNGGTSLFITDGDRCDDPLMDNGNGDGVPLLNDDTVGLNNLICEDAADVNPITDDCNFAAIGPACTPAKPGFSDTSYKDTDDPPKRKTSLLLNDDTVGTDNLISEDSGDVNPMTDDYNFVAATDADCTHAKPGVSGTSCKDTDRPRKRRKAPNVRWRTDMSQFLMASLVDQAKNGLKFDKFFRKEAYVAAARAVNERFDAEVSESNVENHLKTIKANYAAIKRLLDMPGVVFDADLKQINMDPDDVKKHLKAYPNDDRFLNTPIKFFDEMAIICSDIQVTTTHDKGVRDDIGIASQDNASPSMDEDNIGLNDVEFTQLQDNQYPPPSVSATTEKTPSSSKGTRNSEILVLRDIASSICDLVSAIKASLSKDFANELYAEVMKCEGFEEEALGMAFDYLMENEMRARSFLAKSKLLRQSWMSRYLQGSQR